MQRSKINWTKNAKKYLDKKYKMKEERVFGKDPEVYKMLKQMYMIVFKEKQMDKLKGR